MVTESVVEKAVVDMLRDAVTHLPGDVEEALRHSEKAETNPVAKTQLRTILENVDAAGRLRAPMCQDTGVQIFIVRGRVFEGLEEGIRKGVARATKEIPLRPNAVHPLT
jgi:fumarate hydratase subunit alpha